MHVLVGVSQFSVPICVFHDVFQLGHWLKYSLRTNGKIMHYRSVVTTHFSSIDLHGLRSGFGGHIAENIKVIALFKLASHSINCVICAYLSSEK